MQQVRPTPGEELKASGFNVAVLNDRSQLERMTPNGYPKIEHGKKETGQ